MSVPGISSGISVTSSPRSREETVNRAAAGHKRNLGEIRREAVKPVNHFIFLTDNWPDGPVGDQSAKGRVYAAETLITTPQTVSIALGAALITVAGYQALLLTMAATITLAACYLLTRPEQRRTARRPAAIRTAAASTAAGHRRHQARELPGNGHPAGLPRRRLTSGCER
jgi:hypothetical protein